MARVCSRPQDEAGGVPLVVDVDHEGVKVAEVEDDRHPKSLVHLDAVEEQPIDQRSTRLSLVVIYPLWWRVLGGMALYRRKIGEDARDAGGARLDMRLPPGPGPLATTSRRISASRPPFDLGARIAGSMSIDPTSSCCPCHRKAPSHG